MFKPPAAVQAEYQDFRSGPRPHDCWFQFQMAVATNDLTKLNQVVHWAQNSCPSSGPSASPAQMGHGGLANKTSQWWFMMMIMMCYSVWHLTCTHVTLVTCDTFIQVINCSAVPPHWIPHWVAVKSLKRGPARPGHSIRSLCSEWVQEINLETLILWDCPRVRVRDMENSIKLEIEAWHPAMLLMVMVKGTHHLVQHTEFGDLCLRHGQAQASNWSLEIIDYIVCLLILELTLQSLQGAEALAKFHQRSISCKN